MLIASNYQSPFPVANGHLETIIPYFFRKPQALKFSRERIETLDHDFLDLDWLRYGNRRLAILSHGLEGCSQSNYILGLSKFLSDRDFDVIAWNNRGCSGETNNLVKMYHSGASYDLREVVNHVAAQDFYHEIYLIGFSMGGNITLKYLGEEGANLNPRIRKAVAVSTPVYLPDCAKALSQGFSQIYSRKFIISLVEKLRAKKKKFPDFQADLDKLGKLWSFVEFDNALTAPLHGFKDADDYWNQSSSIRYIQHIQCSTLILNSLNDPFLHGQCYPFAETKDHPFVDLETPAFGGHVGFSQGGVRQTWMDQRVYEYLTSI